MNILSYVNASRKKADELVSGLSDADILSVVTHIINGSAEQAPRGEKIDKFYKFFESYYNDISRFRTKYNF